MAVLPNRAIDPNIFINPATGKTRTGWLYVYYRDTRGQKRRAKVLGPGTNAGTLKLELLSLYSKRRAERIIDNVPAATGEKQTGVYFRDIRPVGAQI
jgi:hypothetical protein